MWPKPAALSFTPDFDGWPLLVVGACFQLLVSFLIPLKLIPFSTPALLIVFGFRQFLANNRPMKITTLAQILPGRWTARIYSEVDAQPQGITVFLVGISINQ